MDKRRGEIDLAYCAMRASCKTSVVGHRPRKCFVANKSFGTGIEP